MKIVAEGWNVVVVGAWNVAILNPEWLGKNLFDDPKIQIEVPIGGQPVALMRVTGDGVRVLISSDRVTLSPIEINDASLTKLEALVAKLLRQLPHTPLVGLGVNFKFVEADPGEHLIAHFQDRDLDAITQLGFVSEAQSQTRHLRFGDDRRLNLKIRLAGHNLEIDCNFHHEVKTAEAARDAVNGHIIEYRDLSFRLLTGVYNLTVEQETGVGNVQG